MNTDQSEQPKGEKPDLVGALKVAAWLNTAKDGRKFLAVKFGNRVDLYANEEKGNNIEIEDIFD